jgi:site-specific DNA-methyltransferase (adenine-specific)
MSDYLSRYSITAEIVPRDVFPGFNLPLTVVTFRKDYERRLVGLAFIDETNEWRKMPDEYHAILHRSRTNVWVAACERALRQLGRPATVEEIRNVISGARPTQTTHWQAAIRKALQLHFERLERGLYALPNAA